MDSTQEQPFVPELQEAPKPSPLLGQPDFSANGFVPEKQSPLAPLYDQASKEDAAKTAETLRLARETGSDPAYVSENTEGAKRAAVTHPPGFFEDMEKNHPGTAKFVSLPPNMASFHDKLPDLTAHESLIQDIYKGSLQTASFVNRTLALPFEAFGNTTNDWSTTAKWLDDHAKVVATPDQDKPWSDALTGDFKALGAKLAGQIPTLAMMGGGVEGLGVKTIAGVMGVGTMSEAHAQSVEKGLPAVPAWTSAAFKGAVAGGTMLLPLTYFSRLFAPLEAQLGRDGARKAIASAAATWGETGLAMGGQSMAQNFGNDVADFVSGENPKAFENLGSQMGESFLGGTATGLALGALPAGATIADRFKEATGPISEPSKAGTTPPGGPSGPAPPDGVGAKIKPESINIPIENEINKARAQYLELGKQAEALKERDPLTYKEAVKGMGPETKEVFFPKDDFQVYFQSKYPGDPQRGMDEIQKELETHELGERVKTSLETGMDVRIPLDVWLTLKAGTKDYEALADHAKFDPDSFTPHELEQEKQNQADLLEAAQRVKELQDKTIKETESEVAKEEHASALKGAVTALAEKMKALKMGGRGPGFSEARWTGIVQENLAKLAGIKISDLFKPENWKLHLTDFVEGNKEKALKDAWAMNPMKKVGKVYIKPPSNPNDLSAKLSHETKMKMFREIGVEVTDKAGEGTSPGKIAESLFEWHQQGELLPHPWMDDLTKFQKSRGQGGGADATEDELFNYLRDYSGGKTLAGFRRLVEANPVILGEHAGDYGALRGQEGEYFQSGDYRLAGKGIGKELWEYYMKNQRTKEGVVAAWKDSRDEKVYTGVTHAQALISAPLGEGESFATLGNKGTFGFVEDGKFIPRDEMERRMQKEMGQTFFQGAGNAPPFYSKLQKTIESKMPENASAEQVKGIIKDMNQEERKWSGIDEFLKGKEKVSKAELLDFLRANQLEIKEITKGADQWDEYSDEELRDHLKDLADEQVAGPEAENPDNMDREQLINALADYEDADAPRPEDATKFAQWQLPGGTNYQEKLMVLPGLAYKDSHWDEKGVFGWYRTNDRVDTAGKKVLFSEEFQAGLHQSGRKLGYRTDEKPVLERLDKARTAAHKTLENVDRLGYDLPAQALNDIRRNPESIEAYDLPEEAKAVLREYTNAWAAKKAHGETVPDAPFRKTWHEFFLKRLIREAAEKGYDKIGWTTGEQQAERYDLSKKVEDIKVEAPEEAPGVHFVDLRLTAGKVINLEVENGKVREGEFDGKDLSEVIGKEMAAKIIAVETGTSKSFTGPDLKIGGEGMKGFYDKIIPDFLNKFGKKYGAKVEDSKIGGATGENLLVLFTGGGAAGEVWGVVDNTKGHEELPLKEFEDKQSAENYRQELIDKGPAITIHTLELTPALRDAALNEGFSLFQGKPEIPKGAMKMGGSPGNETFEVWIHKDRADKSTWIHEAFHIFSQQLKNLADSPNATPEIKKLFQDMLDLSGKKSWAEMTTEDHETLARGAEYRMWEGNIPSRFKGLYNKFTDWMRKLFSTKEAMENYYGQKFTPEARAFYDRFLASGEDIDKAYHDTGYTTDRIPDLSPEALDQLGKLREKAREEAISRLMKKRLAELKPEALKLDEEQKAKALSDTQKEVDELPVFKAQGYLKEVSDGMDPKELASQHEEGKLSPENALRMETAADLFQFKGGSGELAKAILESDRDKLVASRLAIHEKLMEAQKKEWIKDEARKAIHEGNSLELLAAENNIMADLVEKKALNDVEIAKRAERNKREAEYASRTARNIVEKMSWQDAGKPGPYYTSERKSAVKEALADARGDHKKADEYRNDRLVAHALAREAEKVKAEVKGTFKNFDKFQQPDSKLGPGRDIDLINVGRTLLSKFGIGENDGTNPADHLENLGRYQTEKDVYDSIKVLIDSLVPAAKPMKEINLSQLRDLRQVMDALWHLSRARRKFTLKGKAEDILQVIQTLMGVNEKFVRPEQKRSESNEDYDARLKAWEQNRHEKTRRKISDMEKRKIGFLEIHAAQRLVDSWTTMMDLDDPARPYHEALTNKMRDAVDSYESARKVYIKKIEDAVSPIRDVFEKKSIHSKELDYTFESVGEILGAIQHTGNRSNFQKLLRGNDWGDFVRDEKGKTVYDAEGNPVLDTSKWDKFIDRMHAEKIIRKEHYDALQKIWDTHEELKPLTLKAHKEMYGWEYSTLENKTLETPFGNYPGGYVPAKVDPWKNKDAQTRQERDALDGNYNGLVFPTTGKGFTIQRKEAYAAPLQMDLRLSVGHLDWALRFAHLEPTIKELGRVVFNKEFGNSLDMVNPALQMRMLAPWLSRTARQVVDIADKNRVQDKLYRYLRRKTGQTMLIANMADVISRASDMPIVVASVKPENIAHAVMMYTKGPLELAKANREESNFMANRQHFVGGFDTEKRINNILTNKSWVGKADEFVEEHSYILQEMVHHMMDHTTYLAGKNQFLSELKGEPTPEEYEDAIRHGNDMVIKTHGSNRPSEISDIMVDTAFKKMFIMFFGWFNRQSNWIETGIRMGVRGVGPVAPVRDYLNMVGLDNRYARAGYIVAMGLLIPSIYWQAVHNLMSGRGLFHNKKQKEGEEDKDPTTGEYLDFFLGSSLDSAIAGNLPGLPGMVVKHVLDKTRDDRFGRGLETSPVLGQLEKFSELPSEIGRYSEGKGSARTLTMNILGALQYLDLPTAAVARPAGYAAGWAHGEYHPTSPLDATRGLISGSPSKKNQ